MLIFVASGVLGIETSLSAAFFRAKQPTMPNPMYGTPICSWGGFLGPKVVLLYLLDKRGLYDSFCYRSDIVVGDVPEGRRRSLETVIAAVW